MSESIRSRPGPPTEGLMTSYAPEALERCTRGILRPGCRVRYEALMRSPAEALSEAPELFTDSYSFDDTDILGV